MSYRAVFAVAAIVLLGACQTDPVELQTEALMLAPESLAKRQMQGRRFETEDERVVQMACAGVLQDLGFAIIESSTETGLLVGSKDRDAVEAGQVAGSLILAAIVASLGGQPDPVWETNQKIRISIITKPVPGSILVRVTFQRVIWNTKRRISRVQTIEDPEIYQQFFGKLSQSVFLEAHSI